MAKTAFSILILALNILLVWTGSRALIRALPGDPVETLIAETGTRINPAELRAELGTDRPFIEALVSDAVRAAGGDWGKSILSGEPVFEQVGYRFAMTLELVMLALAIGLLSATLLGLWSAASRSGYWPGRLTGAVDRFTTLFGAAAAALPTPWLGPLMIYFFAVAIPLFPLGGSPLLPAFTLSIGFTGLWARLIRERVTETLKTGAAKGALARGIGDWKVLFRYGLIPSAGALVAYLGTQIGSLLAGTFVTEVIFNWPGLGTLLIDSVLSRDYPIVEGAVFMGAVTSLVGTYSGDVVRRLLDPKAREESL